MLIFFECQLFLVFGYVGVDNSSFLMKGMLFYFLTGAILVPVEIELVLRFGLLPSPHVMHILAKLLQDSSSVYILSVSGAYCDYRGCCFSQ